MPGQYDGFTNPPTVAEIRDDDINAGEIEVITVGTRRYHTEFSAGVTGDLPAGTFEWLFTSGPDGGRFNNKWGKGIAITLNDVEQYFIGGANSTITLTEGNWYTMNFADNGYNNTDGILMETSSQPGVLTDGGSANTPLFGQPTVVTATYTTAPATEQNTYIRYSTDDFLTSAYVQMTCTGTVCTGNIPDQGAGTMVDYYILSSTLSTGSDLEVFPDLSTINSDINGGANYTYTEPAVMPVEWSQFTVELMGPKTLLTWATTTEQNNDYFAVQRSTNATDYQTIGRVAGNGTTEIEQQYRFVDERTPAGVSYYRLAQTDFDGTIHYSKILSIERRSEVEVDVYPNPVSEVLYYQYPEVREAHRVFVRSAAGNIVLADRFREQGRLDVAELPNGLYFLEIVNRSGVAISTRRFVK